MKLAHKILLLTASLAVTSIAVTLLGPASSVAAQGAADEPPPPDERSLAYRYDAQLGWFPRANHQITYTGSRRIHIAHNARGFRDKEHTLEKTRQRLVFVGDSFVWGYDVELGERFTEYLQADLAAVEVLNFGVSGYGTDQCYLLVQQFFDDYRPDAVIYLFNQTDLEDNAVNFNYRAYYKPYYVMDGDALELRGVPVPRASVWSRFLNSISRAPRLRSDGATITPPLISAMNDYVKSRGASFAVGMIDEEPLIRRHLEQQKIVYFDLTHVDHRYRYPGHGFHWTPAGHQLVARAIKAFLLHNSAARAP